MRVYSHPLKTPHRGAKRLYDLPRDCFIYAEPRYTKVHRKWWYTSRDGQRFVDRIYSYYYGSTGFDKRLDGLTAASERMLYRSVNYTNSRYVGRQIDPYKSYKYLCPPRRRRV